MQQVLKSEHNMQTRIREVVANTQVVDGDALLTPLVMARIVSAVMAAMKASQDDESARQRDTRLGSQGTCSHSHVKGGGQP